MRKDYEQHFAECARCSARQRFHRCLDGALAVLFSLAVALLSLRACGSQAHQAAGACGIQILGLDIYDMYHMLISAGIAGLAFSLIAFALVLMATPALIDGTDDFTIRVSDRFDVYEGGAARAVRALDLCFLVAHGNTGAQNVGHRALVVGHQRPVGPVHPERSAEPFFGGRRAWGNGPTARQRGGCNEELGRPGDKHIWRWEANRKALLEIRRWESLRQAQIHSFRPIRDPIGLVEDGHGFKSAFVRGLLQTTKPPASAVMSMVLAQAGALKQFQFRDLAPICSVPDIDRGRSGLPIPPGQRDSS